MSTALALAEPAVARAGSPILATAQLARLRGSLAMRRGRYAEAIPPLREALALDDRYRFDAFGDAPRALATALVANGQGADALAESKRWYEDALRTHEPLHPTPRWRRHVHAMVQEVTGDVAGALATREALTELSVQTNPASHATIWDRLYKLELELRLGKQPADADEAIRKVAGLGTTPPRENPDGIATARRAGMFAVFAYGADRPGVTGELERLDNAATLAFWRGDRARAIDLAMQLAAAEKRCSKPCVAWSPFARWLALLADPQLVTAGIAVLDEGYREISEPQPVAFAQLRGGIVLATLGRWDDARLRLEKARAEPYLWESQADLVELDGWLGLARVKAGDLAGARTLFEEALLVLSIWSNGFDGLCYMTPVIEVALADILWTQPDGDRARARRLVQHAIAGFTKLGSGRDTERAAATRWLAEHPL